MPYTNQEKQRRFKEKMYEAGFKQMILWVKRKETRQTAKMTRREFVKSLNKLTYGWDEGSLTRLYCLLIKVAKGKKEAARLKEKT